MANNCVAVVVPCYNAAATLAATLESTFAQNIPVEVIVVDDGSTDGSLAIGRSFEPKLRVVSGANRGASAARNAGIAATSAEWIVFVDADDILEPATLSKRLLAGTAENADVVICDWLDVNDDGSGQLTPGAHQSVDWVALKENAELATAMHVWAT